MSERGGWNDNGGLQLKVERHNGILVLLLVAIAAGIIGCETSNPEHARNTATVSDPRFVKGLDHIASRPGQVLVCVSYWNGWQAIARSRDGRNYEAYTWSEHGFRRTEGSPLIRASLAEEVYDHLVPLDSAYRAASLDYSQVLDTKKDWKMINKTLHVLPVPSLMAIKIKALFVHCGSCPIGRGSAKGTLPFSLTTDPYSTVSGSIAAAFGSETGGGNVHQCEGEAMTHTVSYGSMCLISLALGYRVTHACSSFYPGPIVGVLALLVVVPWLYFLSQAHDVAWLLPAGAAVGMFLGLRQASPGASAMAGGIALVVALANVLLWLFGRSDLFPWITTGKSLLNVWWPFAAGSIFLTGLSYLLVARVAWRWSLAVLVVLLYGLFINAWLFVPLCSLFVIGYLTAPEEAGARIVLRPIVLWFIGTSVIITGHYLVLEVLWFRLSLFGGSPEAILIMAGPLFLFQGAVGWELVGHWTGELHP